MVPFRVWLTTAFVSGVILGSLLSAQVDDEKKSPPKQDESEQIEAHSSPSPKPKKSPTPVAKASKDKSGKKHKASATSEKVPTAIPHAKLANDKSNPKKKNRRHHPKERRQKKSRPATITNRGTHRNPLTLVKQSQNLTTKSRQRQSLRRARRLSTARNQSGATRLHPNRNPRRKKPRKFQAKRTRRGNPNRREKKRKHRNRKKRRRPAQKSALQDPSGQLQPRKLSSLQRRRRRLLLSQKLRVLVQPASGLRL